MSITLPFPAGREVNFELVQTSFITTLQGIKYDYHSIMHYRSTAFTKNGQVTISSKDPNVPNSALGQRVQLSDLDLQHARLQYNCPGGPTGGSWGAWSSWSNCSRACNTGTQMRNRTCVGGSACTGDSTETRNCNTHNCPGMLRNTLLIVNATLFSYSSSHLEYMECMEWLHSYMWRWTSVKDQNLSEREQLLWAQY